MALDFILLGMLRDDASGYDLRNAFAEGPRHFWSAELSQIYPALHNMEKRGWLTSRCLKSQRGPTRRLYHRTVAGTRALHRWLRQEPEVGTERLAYIGQLVFQGELRDPPRTLQFLEVLRTQLLDRQKQLESAEQSLDGTGAKSPPGRWDDDQFHELLCLRLGVRSLEGKVAACDECIALVRARAKEPRHA